GQIDGKPFQLGKALVSPQRVIVLAEGDTSCNALIAPNLPARFPPPPEGRSIMLTTYPASPNATGRSRLVYWTRLDGKETQTDVASNEVTITITQFDASPGGHVTGSIDGKGSGDLRFELSGTFDAEICRPQ